MTRQEKPAMTMRHYIGDQQIVADDEALELALDLWLGDEDEDLLEKAARLDAGRDMLQEDPELFDRAVRVISEALDAAPRGASVTTLRPRRRTSTVYGEVAA